MDRVSPAEERSTGLRGALAIVFLNRYAVMVIGFVSTVILAHLVKPADVGLFSVAASIVMLAQGIRDFGVGEFLVQERALTGEKIRTAFGLTLILAWSLGLIFFLSRGWISAAYHDSRLAHLIGILCLSFVVAPFSSTVLALLNRNMAFGSLLRISLAGCVVNNSVSISLAELGWGSTALTCGMVAMNTTTAVTAALFARSWDHFIPSVKEWRAVMSFGTYMSLAAIIGQITVRLPDLIIGKMLGFQSLGFYNRANGLVQTFNDTVVAGVHTVAFPAFASTHREGRDVRQPYLHAIALLTGVAFPALTGAAIGARPLIQCLLGADWAAAAILVPPLAVGYCATLVAPMADVYLSATGFVRAIPRIAFAIQIVQLSVLIAATNFGTVWVAAGSSLSGVVQVVISSYYLRRTAGIHAGDLWQASRKSLLVTAICVPVALGAITFPALQGKPWLIIITEIISGGLAWLAGVVLIRHPIAREITLVLRECRRPLVKRTQ